MFFTETIFIKTGAKIEKVSQAGFGMIPQYDLSLLPVSDKKSSIVEGS